MPPRSWIYKSVSLLTVIGLLLQLFPPPLVRPAGAREMGAPPQALDLAGALLPDMGAAEAALAASAAAPAALANPISLSRVQSAYVPGAAIVNTVVVTFTVTNNRLPTLVPSLPLTATITETVDILAGFDATADVNTVRNVVLADGLAPGAALVAATPRPDQSGTALRFNLGDIAPGSSVTATLALQVPAGVADFTALDEGAAAYGTLQGRMVSAAAAPATLAPDSFGDYLIWTPDADIYDVEMLQKAAELGHDPLVLFAYVRGLGYEAYEGSLRGTRGTLWSEAGNSLDQASLLIAMLRAGGVPARYARGTLGAAPAQELILSMFPEPTQFIGHVPAGADVADPANDAALLAEVQDHWWVEAYVGGQWLSLDPSFAGAQPGETFAAAAETRAEVPDSVRHKIAIRLKVENYHPLNTGSGSLAYATPFARTLNSVEVAAQPVSFSHLVSTEEQPGMVFATISHTYTPYLLIGDRDIFGEAYQEIFSTFPLGTLLLTGAWLELDLIAPGGAIQSYERELKDRIGYENRFHGGTADLAVSGDDSALFTDFDILSFGFWPNFVPAAARERAQAVALATSPAVTADSQRLMALQTQDSFTAAEQDELRGIRLRYQLNMSRFLSNLALSFAEAADRLALDLGEGGLVKSYYDAPRLIIAGSELLKEETGSFSLDLRRTTLRTSAYPGQNERATVGFNIARGVVESGIEGAVLATSLGVPAATTARLFAAAEEQGIFPVMVDAGNLYTLDGLTISEQGKARITAAALAGKLALVPHAPVLLEGEYQSGWWEIDPFTGETIGVMENGLHLAALEYVGNLANLLITGPVLDAVMGFTAYTWGFIADHVDKAIGPDTFDLDKYNWYIGLYATSLTCIGNIASPSAYALGSCWAGTVGGAAGLPMDFFAAGQELAQSVLSARVQHDPPLAEGWLAHRLPAAPVSEVTGTLTDPAVFSPGPLSLSLDTSHIFHSGAHQAEWAGSGRNVYPFTALTLSQADLFDTNGALLGSGALMAAPAGAGPAFAAGTVDASADGDGRAAYYGPATGGAAPGGLGGSAAWSPYEGQLSSSALYTLTLTGAVVSLNGVDYRGDLTVATSATALLEGHGNGAAANFAPSALLHYTNADLVIGPATGTATANGAAVDTTNGLAIANSDQTLALAAAGAGTAHVELEDTVDFFTLNLAPGSSATDPQTAVSFQAGVAANFGGAYTLTVGAPAGWHLSLDGSGEVTARPARGAAPGDYAILVTARSATYPDLALSAVHTVSVGAFDGLLLSVQPDPLFTVPMGPEPVSASLIRHATNSGRVQVPGAAYTILITNTANGERNVDLSTAGLPAGWTLLSSGPGATEASLALGPGEVGQLGLYVNPGDLPPAGASYNFTVSALSDTGQAAQDGATFTMPAVPFSFVQPEPATLYAAANTTATLALTLTNVGNAAGTFPLSARGVVDFVTTTAGLQSPVALGPGERHSQAVTLEIGDAPAGQTFPVFFDSPVPGTVYTQTAAVLVRAVTASSLAVFEAADNACTQSQPGLSAALMALALAMTELESTCDSGDCSLALRDRVVAALEAAATYAGWVSPLVTAGDSLQAIAGDMAGHASNADLEADLAAIGAAISELQAQVCEVGEHRVALSWAPAYDAGLPGQPVTYTLSVENQGTVTTTYAITLDLPSGQSTLEETIAAGSTVTYEHAVAVAGLGLYELAAAAEAIGPDVTLGGIGDGATARLHVVDRFVQVTAVTADPPFVETGGSETTLSVAVSNVANVARPANAQATILAADGSPAWTTGTPLTVLVGAPRSYELATVDTSGWAAGAYTVTVELLDDDGALVPDGSGYGYLSVGQALEASHAVSSVVAGPGAMTVTTAITTAIAAGAVQPAAPAQPLARWPERPPLRGGPAGDEALPPAGDDADPPAEPEAESPEPEPLANTHPSLLTSWAITRTENGSTVVTYGGAWSAVADLSADHASNGDYHRSQTAGDSAAFSFAGTWVAVGLITSRQSGYAEIFLDGASQGLLDLYSHGNDVRRVTFGGLADTAHTVTVAVAGQQNPFSSGSRVAVDYFDTWDGTTMPDGTFEQDDGRVWLSDGWSNLDDAGASGGSYYRNGHTAWFPFTGDSLTFQAMTHANAERIALYLDDDFWGTYDISDFSVHTRTVTFAGLGAGPHVLTVRAFHGQATVDSFTTPATEAATPPPVIGSFHRYEEYDPAILYNGFPFTRTATTWAREANDTVSGHFTHLSGAPGDTASLAFTGTGVGVGFYAERRGGLAEIFIDGASQGVYDTYRRDPGTMAVYFHDLPDAAHTISVTVLGQANPLATTDNVYVDYFDVWDGVPIAQGSFAEVDERVLRSYRFSLMSNPQAGGGQYLQDGTTGAASVWFPFTGDSVSFHAMANNQGSRWTKVSVDGRPLAEINLYNNTPVTRTFSFEGLGAGPHILQVERYRGELLVDGFTTPGAPPFHQTPDPAGIVRYEEDDPALRYNGEPFGTRPQSWSSVFAASLSGGYAELSTTAGDTASLTFEGRWVSAGFYTHQYGGQAEIFVDGVSRGTVGLYSADPGVERFTVADLVTGTHTISITVLGLVDPPGTQARVHLDYVDVWDGQRMGDDVADVDLAENSSRVHLSPFLAMVSSPDAIGGSYASAGAGSGDANAWYGFTGDSFTFYGFSRNSGTGLADVYVDGQFVETVDLFYPFTQQPLAFHFGGFGPGPHVARINDGGNFRVDAFASNETAIPYRPLAEWVESDRTAGGSIWGGIHVPAVAGDVTGDGAVELVVASSNIDHNGELFLMKGDGSDAGDGTPIIWSVPFDIFNGFEHVGAPAIADLDGQPGAEIVIATVQGLYAFHADGSTYWFTDTLKPHVFFGTPAIGNLDLDPEPEIVVNLDNTLAVFEQDGSLAWSHNDPDGVGMPVLADLTGDGLLNILFQAGGDTLSLYDYNLGSPSLVWTVVFTNPLHIYGPPAVADLDGDGTPEVAIAGETRLFALNGADGSVHWSAPLDPGITGGVTIADIDGDGAVELVTGVVYDGGTLYAFEGDGTLKWSAPALDSSPLNTSAADLDGDGAAELLWNGLTQGFTIYDGRTGAVLFNEPLANSATGSDVPIAVDVDLDGYAEIVVPAKSGIRVFGFDGVWGPARPLWNQLTYHITNVGDDLAIPLSEANSWETHNSYRAQWPESFALPAYDVTLAHEAAGGGVTVLTDTFSTPPTTALDPLYGWDYSQSWMETAITRTFQSLLTGLQPGEARRVAEGTAVSYTMPSGTNYLELPPLYVTVPHVVDVLPAAQTTGAGGAAVYDVVLSNPAAAAAVYTLTVAGLPAGWLSVPPPVPLAAGEVVTVALAVAVPPDAEPAEMPFVVSVTTGSGGADQAGATLTVIDGLELALAPAEQTAATGAAVTYTLTLTNSESAGRAYALSVSGNVAAGLPATVTVPAGQSVTLPFTAVTALNGPQPFTVHAAAAAAGESATAILNALGFRDAGVALAPATAAAGPGTPAVYTLTVTNGGSLPDSYDLAATLPGGWRYRIVANGQELDGVSLPPHVFNAADLQLLVTPPLTATPGLYEVGVAAASRESPGVTAAATAAVEVLDRGVQVEIAPAATSLSPAGTGTWQVAVTNTGSVADSYWLTPTGIVALSASFSTNPVTLAPGQSTNVELAAGSFDFALPATYPFGVVATSAGDDRIQQAAGADVTFSAIEAVEVAWQPAAQTISDTLSATFLLVITNTGNVSTGYAFALDAPGLAGTLPVGRLSIPAHVSVALPVTVVAPGAGSYTLEGSALADGGGATDSASATLVVFGGNSAPTVNAGANQTVEEGTAVAFSGSASDPDGDPLTITWHFGDGSLAAGTLTPSHAYADNGSYLVTLVVTDSAGMGDSDSLLVTVINVPPVVSAGSDRTVTVLDQIPFNGSFTDPGTADSHTIQWDFGDGNHASGSLTPAHIYTSPGIYTVTLAITDDDSGRGVDSMVVTVEPIRLYLPMVRRVLP
jgi:uncharacterized membrane protein